MNVVLLGPPASGKGTQAKLLADRGFLHLSTGDMLRAERNACTDLGCRIATALDAGELVSDELVTELIRQRLSGQHVNVVFDGYPRTVKQAASLDSLLASFAQTVDVAIALTVDTHLLLSRMTKRYCEQGRSDDNPDSLRRRLQSYDEMTSQLFPYYRKRGVLVEIDGMPQVDVVSSQIAAHIGRYQ